MLLELWLLPQLPTPTALTREAWLEVMQAMAQASDLQAKLLPSYLATVKTIKRAVQPLLALLLVSYLLLTLLPLTPHSQPLSTLFVFSSLLSSFLLIPLTLIELERYTFKSKPQMNTQEYPQRMQNSNYKMSIQDKNLSLILKVQLLL